MSKLTNQIMKMDFPKFFRDFVIAAVIIVLLGGVVTAAAFRTQISEVIAYERTEDIAEQEGRDTPEAEHDDSREEKHHGDFEDLPLTRPSRDAKATLAIFGLVCLAAFGIYWLTVSAWLYQAAENTGFHGFLWFLLALGGNLFAVILYLLVRSFLCEKCSSCGKWQSRKHQYCVFCGMMMYEKCPDCGSTCNRNAWYCTSCGKRLHD